MEPLLPSSETVSSLPSNTNDPIPVHNFLKLCPYDTYYRGFVYKQQQIDPFTVVKSVVVKAAGYMEFIVYKFEYNINGTNYKFCITFRKKHTSLLYNGIDKYHIRLSLLFDERYTCNGVNALMLTSDGNLEHPNNIQKNFTSVITGQIKILDTLIKDWSQMEQADDISLYEPTVTAIIAKINEFGPLLIEKCEAHYQRVARSSPSRGGSKSRKHLSRKRKFKMSYKKSKYGKSKKSRRLRRSVKSRR